MQWFVFWTTDVLKYFLEKRNKESSKEWSCCICGCKGMSLHQHIDWSAQMDVTMYDITKHQSTILSIFFQILYCYVLYLNATSRSGTVVIMKLLYLFYWVALLLFVFEFVISTVFYYLYKRWFIMSLWLLRVM